MSTAPSQTRSPPERPPDQLGTTVTLVLFFAGASLGMSFLSSIGTALAVPVVAGVLTLCRGLGDRLIRRRGRMRLLGFVALLPVAAAYAFFVYCAVTWGSLLYWTIPGWGLIAVAGLAVAAVVTPFRSWRGVRVPLALPLGAFIALCLNGWLTEELVVHCDDYIDVRDQPGTEIVVASTEALETCTKGAYRPIGRYPRMIWETPTAGRLLVANTVTDPTREIGPFTGSLCELRDGSITSCIGGGKAQTILDAPELDRTFVPTWGKWEDGSRGRLLVLAREPPLRVEDMLAVDRKMGEGYYDPGADRFYGFTDEGEEIIPIVASTLERQPTIADLGIWGPGAIRYDTARGEGVLCVGGAFVHELNGERYVAVAVSGDPPVLRPLGGDGLVSTFGLSWGCDWDPVDRTVWVAVPNLGLLVVIDYDTGEILRTHFVDFGIRSVTFDRASERLYLTNFLAGYVSVVDAPSGAETDRFLVGRFPRMVTISRDRRALFVGSSLGVIRAQP